MSVPHFGNLTYVKNLAGSTGAKEYVNKNGKHWVIKRGAVKGQIQAEATANDIYEAVGIPVPKHELEEEKEEILKLEFIKGSTFGQIKDKTKQESIKKELQKGFVIDALLANWDVIGLNRDNILIPDDGSPPVRIDNGGTFTFRASGKPKAFGSKVTELKTMRDPQKAPQAAAVFQGLAEVDIHEQIMYVVKPNYSKILSLTPDHLKPAMKARMDDLLSIIHAPNYGFAPNDNSSPVAAKPPHSDITPEYKEWTKKALSIIKDIVEKEDQRLQQLSNEEQNEKHEEQLNILEEINAFLTGYPATINKAVYMDTVDGLWEQVMNFYTDYITLVTDFDNAQTILQNFPPWSELEKRIGPSPAKDPKLWSKWIKDLVDTLMIKTAKQKSEILYSPKQIDKAQLDALDDIQHELTKLSKIREELDNMNTNKKVPNDPNGWGQMYEFYGLNKEQNTEKKSFDALHSNIDNLLSNIAQKYRAYHDTYSRLPSWEEIMEKVGPPPDYQPSDYQPVPDPMQDYEKDKQRYQYEFIWNVLEAANKKLDTLKQPVHSQEQQEEMMQLYSQLYIAKDAVQKFLKQDYNPEHLTYEMDMDIGKAYKMYETYRNKNKQFPRWNKLVPDMDQGVHPAYLNSKKENEHVVGIIYTLMKQLEKHHEKKKVLPTTKDEDAIDYLINESDAVLRMCTKDSYYCDQDTTNDITRMYRETVHYVLVNLIQTYAELNDDKKKELLTLNTTKKTIYVHMKELLKYIHESDKTSTLRKQYEEIKPYMWEETNIEHLANEIVMVKSLIPEYQATKPATKPSKVNMKTVVNAESMSHVQSQIQPDPTHDVVLAKKGVENNKNKVNQLTENTKLIEASGNSAKKRVNKTDMAFIWSYTDKGFEAVNYLLGSIGKVDTISKKSFVYRLLQAVFPLKNGETPAEYNQRLMYYYMVNLYNAIQKGPAIHTNNYIKLYRGTNTWYLSKNTDVWRYTNTFTSTTMDSDVIYDFTSSKRHYIFYVHPACRYMNISKMSKFPQELEVLLTPYHRYLFIDSSVHYQKFLVLPTNLDIPNTYETFIPWKNTVAGMTNQQEGGDIAAAPNRYSPIAIMGSPYLKEKMTKIPLHYKHPLLKTRKGKKSFKKGLKTRKGKSKSKSLNRLKTRKGSNIVQQKATLSNAKQTLKSNREVKNVMKTSEGFRQRMTTPITTLPGKPLTKEEREYVDRMAKVIRADKIAR